MKLRTAVLSPVSETSVQYLPDAYVEVQNGQFTRVEAYRGQQVDETLRGVITPGFVDGHVHAAQTRIIGSASGPLLQWLQQSTFPEEARLACAEHALEVYELFVDSVLAAGTTFVMAYGSVHDEGASVLFEVLARRGLRAIAGPVLMNEHCPQELVVPTELALQQLEALGDKWHLFDAGRLQVAVIPRFALSCSGELMKAAGELALRKDWWVTTHLSESRIECEIATERFLASDYLEVYERFNLVHKKSVFAHCIHLSEGEWRRFKASGAVIAHCPDSNDFLGSGGMPLAPYLEERIPMVIGTDVAAGRSFRVARSLSHAYDNAMRQKHQLSLSQLFWWGTRGGALALQQDVGQITPGKEADFVHWETPSYAACSQTILSHLLFNGDCPPARRVFVRGKELIMRTMFATS